MMKTELPDDINLLKAMLAQHQTMLKQQQAQMKQQQTQLRTYAGQVAGYEREIERLKAQLDKLKRIAALYAIEADIRGSPEETRLAVRKEKSCSLMRSLSDWIQVQLKTLSVHAEMAKAFGYMLKQ